MPVNPALRRAKIEPPRPRPAPVAPKPAPKPADIVDVIDDVLQGSPEWLALRLGMPSASRFATIIASGIGGEESKTRRKLLYMLAGERLTGEPAETFRNDAMDRGNSMEQEALDYYARTRFVDLRIVGFIRRTINPPFGNPYVVGCSPDALVVGKRKAVEIKTMRPDLLIEVAMKGAAGFPGEHRAQTQGTLWVADLDEIDLMIFYRGMPVAPTFTIERDEAFIKRLSEEVERFVYELDQLVEKLRSMGKRP